MILDVAIFATVLLVMLVLWAPRVHHQITWRATTTPLASIIGSGFLVLGPILNKAYGAYAPLTMAGLCGGAYLFGYAVRYNMAVLATGDGHRPAMAERLETVASWSLSFAYIISVSYYLNLFGSFGTSMTAATGPTPARLLTTAVYVIILFVGWTRGFRVLESLEYITGTGKMAIIAGFLVALGAYTYGKAATGTLVVSPPALAPWPALTLAFGLIVTVQGFETSRYLGREYDAATRIQSMRWAQWTSAAIYMLYVVLLAYGFDSTGLKLTQTTIIDMMRLVAPILPVLLVAAALAAQFSAAVADTSGSGGLFAELTGGRVSARMGYAGLTVVGLGLTWTANVFEIINYASRAFAFYYALQAMIAAVTAHRAGERPWKVALFVGLALFGLAVVLFGQAAEA